MQQQLCNIMQHTIKINKFQNIKQTIQLDMGVAGDAIRCMNCNKRGIQPAPATPATLNYPVKSINYTPFRQMAYSLLIA